MLKLITKIITKHSDQILTSEEQQGFRNNRSTIDATFILRQIIEKAIEFNKPAYLCFVDLIQAFDRIQLTELLNILHENQVDAKIVKLIKELNTENTTKIKTNYGITEEIPVASGGTDGDTEDEDNLQRILHKLHQEAEKYMKISTPKTKSMVISKEPIRCKLVIDNQLIEQVSSFNYLGVNISSSRDITKEVRLQANRASLIAGYLRNM